jgi:succinate dehydrogenase / fumarate reductase cytochrome b subunit
MTAPAALNPKGPPAVPPSAGFLAWADAYLTSTVGQKLVVALTGAGLVGFTLFHMTGNLKMFPGGTESREAVNAYAHFLKHGLGVWLWLARGGLLAIFLLHLYVALRLARKAAAARPVGYAVKRSARPNPAAATMAWTGIVVGAFVLFHLAHYTFGWVHAAHRPGGPATPYLDLRDPDGRHDVYNMVVAGFSTWWVAVLYLAAQVLLFVHLSHGIPSAFQTLGLKSRRFARAIQVFGLAVAGVILVGNVAIVLAVWAGYVGYVG